LIPEKHMKKTEWDDFWNIDESSIVQPRREVYEISIDTFFNARHFVVMDGKPGEEHSHSYRIQVRCRSNRLDQQQMIVGFADFRKTIHRVTQIYNNSLLNELPPFKNIQATTEALSAVMFQQLERLLANDNLELVAVTLWESPDEGVTYERRQS
jgi:6-pyruvoyltetrahydropterin/6-carboxytetrahydropterin synthase